MHCKCEKCHKETAVKLERVELSYCTACHTDVPKVTDRSGRHVAEKIR
jgi:Zn finger protein HypA/HybF involved in hydrogenase expression